MLDDPVTVFSTLYTKTLQRMLQPGEKEAFIHDWTLWSNHVAHIMPVNCTQPSDIDWRFCEALYTLLPLDGRHQDARYRLEVEFNTAPSATELAIGQQVSTVELQLQADVLSDGFVHFVGHGPDDEQLLELRYDHQVAQERLGDVSDYDSITATLEYQEALLDGQADQYESLEDARGRFVDYVTHRNERLGWDKDPTAKCPEN